MHEQLELPSLLIALPSLLDPNFSRTVVLLVEHNADGAMGFIINRAMPLADRDSAFQKRYEIPHSIPLWTGGPLGDHEGLVIHCQGGDPDATAAKGDLRVSSSEEAIEGLVEYFDSIQHAQLSFRERRPLLPYRFVIGYAAWGAKQLEAELKAGAWYQKPLDMKLIFDTPQQEIWPSAIAELGVHPLDITPTVQKFLN